MYRPATERCLRRSYWFVVQALMSFSCKMFGILFTHPHSLSLPSTAGQISHTRAGLKHREEVASVLMKLHKQDSKGHRLSHVTIPSHRGHATKISQHGVIVTTRELTGMQTQGCFAYRYQASMCYMEQSQTASIFSHSAPPP